jgi:outer membrane protein assembly factor BamB
LYCLDAATGKLVWQSEDGNLIKVKPAIADGKVYFTSWGGLVTCLAADTGALIWQKQIDSSFYYAPATGDPLVASGKLIITTPRNRVIALDLLTGEKLWQAESVKAGFCSPALWQDRILVASLDGKVYALDGETGQTIWSGSAGESIYDAKIAADGQVGVTNTCWGSLAAFDLGTGERKWKLKLADAFIFSAPVVSEGVAYVGSTNDHLYAVQYK